jgi:hypothetical protein
MPRRQHAATNQRLRRLLLPNPTGSGSRKNDTCSDARRHRHPITANQFTPAATPAVLTPKEAPVEVAAVAPVIPVAPVTPKTNEPPEEVDLAALQKTPEPFIKEIPRPKILSRGMNRPS